MQALADSGGEADMLQMIDYTIIRAHHCAAARKGGMHRQALGRSRGGVSTKLHLRAKAVGLPTGIVLTPGEAHDFTTWGDLMVECHSNPGVLLGDRGYDSDRFRQDAHDWGAQPEIPTERSRKVQYSVDKWLYALCTRIECFINRLKNCRRVAIRYDHTATSLVGFALLGCIRLWIRFVLAA